MELFVHCRSLSRMAPDSTTGLGASLGYADQLTLLWRDKGHMLRAVLLMAGCDMSTEYYCRRSRSYLEIHYIVPVGFGEQQRASNAHVISTGANKDRDVTRGSVGDKTGGNGSPR